MLDWMNVWINDEKCMLEWMYEKRVEKIRENRGFCLFWFSAKTGRELTRACVNSVRGLTHAMIYTCVT